jgi:hypothetical protein
MSSAFLVFDLLGRDAGLEREGNARGFAHPNLTTLKKRLGISLEKSVSLVPATKALTNSTGRIK